MMHKTKNTGLYRKLTIIGFAFLLCVLLSCDQASIFADIAVEPPPVDPRIPGSPTNMVIYDNKMYVAGANSNSLHFYANGVWSIMPTPGKIVSIAASDEASGKLYALLTDTDAMDAYLARYNGSDWDKIDTNAFDGSIQCIYGTDGYVFVGIRKGGTWSIYYIRDSDPSLTPITMSPDPAQINGVAYDGVDFFFATEGKGIYKSDPGLASCTQTDVTEGHVKGIININGKITAVTSAGNILVYDGTNFVTISSQSDLKYTGAMCVWKKYSSSSWTDTLLLLGVSNTGSSNRGYRELYLPGGVPTIIDGQTLAIPGNDASPSSVDPGDRSKYEASIARYSVYHILQVPDSVDNYPHDGTPGPGHYIDPEGKHPKIFASTMQNGLQVLINGQWNAQP